jgi:hypothetical protein
LDTDKFEAAAQEAMKVKVYKGFEMYTAHLFPHHLFKGLQFDATKEKLLTREKRPREGFYTEVKKMIDKEDIASLDNMVSFSEHIAPTEIRKIGNTKVNKLNPPVVERDASSMTENETTIASGLATASTIKENGMNVKNGAVITNGTSSRSGVDGMAPKRKATTSFPPAVGAVKKPHRYRPGTVALCEKRQDGDDEEEEDDESEEELIEEKTVHSKKRGWEILWDQVTSEVEIKLTRINTSNYETGAYGGYIIPSEKNNT